MKIAQYIITEDQLMKIIRVSDNLHAIGVRFLQLENELSKSKIEFFKARTDLNSIFHESNKTLKMEKI